MIFKNSYTFPTIYITTLFFQKKKKPGEKIHEVLNFNKDYSLKVKNKVDGTKQKWLFLSLRLIFEFYWVIFIKK